MQIFLKSDVSNLASNQSRQNPTSTSSILILKLITNPGYNI